MNASEIFSNNLRGHQYIEARGLSPQAVKAQSHTCDACRRAEMLPAVLQILDRWPVAQEKKVRRIR